MSTFIWPYFIRHWSALLSVFEIYNRDTKHGDPVVYNYGYNLHLIWRRPPPPIHYPTSTRSSPPPPKKKKKKKEKRKEHCSLFLVKRQWRSIYQYPLRSLPKQSFTGPFVFNKIYKTRWNNSQGRINTIFHLIQTVAKLRLVINGERWYFSFHIC